jgi:hypothetical protein
VVLKQHSKTSLSETSDYECGPLVENCTIYGLNFYSNNKTRNVINILNLLYFKIVKFSEVLFNPLIFGVLSISGKSISFSIYRDKKGFGSCTDV